MTKSAKYHVVADADRKLFAVCLANGVIEYDLIESRKEATDICRILNRGIGPEWDAVEAAMKAGAA